MMCGASHHTFSWCAQTHQTKYWITFSKPHCFTQKHKWECVYHSPGQPSKAQSPQHTTFKSYSQELIYFNQESWSSTIQNSLIMLRQPTSGFHAAFLKLEAGVWYTSRGLVEEQYRAAPMVILLCHNHLLHHGLVVVLLDISLPEIYLMNKKESYAMNKTG
jgi:hypothetical protein